MKTDNLEDIIRLVPQLSWSGDVQTMEGDWIGPVSILLPDYPSITLAVWEWIMDHEIGILMEYTRRNMIRLGLDKTNV